MWCKMSLAKSTHVYEGMKFAFFSFLGVCEMLNEIEFVCCLIYSQICTYININMCV
jgi:hypothetical protein